MARNFYVKNAAQNIYLRLQKNQHLKNFDFDSQDLADIQDPAIYTFERMLRRTKLYKKIKLNDLARQAEERNRESS